MKKRLFSIAVILLFATMLLTACSNEPTPPGEEIRNTIEPSVSPTPIEPEEPEESQEPEMTDEEFKQMWEDILANDPDWAGAEMIAHPDNPDWFAIQLPFEFESELPDWDGRVEFIRTLEPPVHIGSVFPMDYFETLTESELYFYENEPGLLGTDNTMLRAYRNGIITHESTFNYNDGYIRQIYDKYGIIVNEDTFAEEIKEYFIYVYNYLHENMRSNEYGLDRFHRWVYDLVRVKQNLNRSPGSDPPSPYSEAETDLWAARITKSMVTRQPINIEEGRDDISPLFNILLMERFYQRFLFDIDISLLNTVKVESIMLAGYNNWSGYDEIWIDFVIDEVGIFRSFRFHYIDGAFYPL